MIISYLKYCLHMSYQNVQIVKSNSEEVADGVVKNSGEESDENGQETKSIFLWFFPIGEDIPKTDENGTVDLEPCTHTRQDEEGHVGLYDQTEQKSNN